MVLAAMTTQEKVAFLGGDNPDGNFSGSANDHTGIQDGVPRLDVPTVYYTDGPLGPRQGLSTAMPAPLGLAASFNHSLARAYARVVGAEAKAKGNDVVYGPTVNIMRTPLGGRTYEAYGEDPFLAAQIASAWVRGLQGTGVLADIKHFAENNQEGQDPTGKANQPGAPLGAGGPGSRYIENSIVDDRTLHEIELMPFQTAISRGRPATVMCSYNRLNGTFACENGALLQHILRREFGFRGYVLADYGAAHNTAASLNNGLDFEPWPPLAYQPAAIDAALITGQAPYSALDDHVRNILATWFRFGVFDRAGYRNDDRQIDKPKDARVARQIEQQAVTLLRNRRHLLPLRRKRVRRIAVIGKPAAGFITGGGSGNVKPFKLTTLLDGIRADAGRGATVTYLDGSDPAAAQTAARNSDVAVVAASDYYTEGADRSCLSLECPSNNGDQDGLIAKVAAANRRTIVVLESGGPDLTPWRTRIGALIEAWYPGGPGGQAVADVLFGKADPGGRLPVTFPADQDQIPTANDPAKYPGISSNVYYKEGVLVGYRWYDARHERPAFPFGYGLSYAHFRFSKLKVRPLRGKRKGFRVTFTVRNTSHRRGWAVPELYVALPSRPGLAEPPVQLKAFAKLALRPHRTRRVTLVLDSGALSYWDANRQQWRGVSGCVGIMVGSSSRQLPLRRLIARGTRRRCR